MFNWINYWDIIENCRNLNVVIASRVGIHILWSNVLEEEVRVYTEETT